MRANITYSLEIEEIPKLISGFIEKIDDDITTTGEKTDDLQRAVASKAYLSSIEIIKETRNLLAKIDLTLEDCQNIIIGYQQTLINQTLEQELASPQGKEMPLQENITNEKTKE